ncbi:MAG: LexA family transcriptional regulator, partial [Gallionella sp.]|nr:LexA family transcriptional regulator [Gallionella sp.]
MTDFNLKDGEYLGKLQDYYADWKSIPSYAKL